jgi:hypothetical protein
MKLDLNEIEDRWLRVCAHCDAGLPNGVCSHPDEDYRPMIALVQELRLAVENERMDQQMIEDQAADIRDLRRKITELKEAKP